MSAQRVDMRVPVSSSLNPPSLFLSALVSVCTPSGLAFRGPLASCWHVRWAWLIYAAVVLCCICPMLFFFFKWRRDKEAEMEGFSGPGKRSMQQPTAMSSTTERVYTRREERGISTGLTTAPTLIGTNNLTLATDYF